MITLKDNQSERYSIVGLTQKEFFCIKKALEKYAAKAADYDKSKDWKNSEIEKALSTMKKFREAEIHQITI